MINLSQSSTWSELQSGLNAASQADKISLSNPPKRNWVDNVVTRFTGRSAVTSKVYHLIQQKLKDHILENRGPNFNFDEQYGLNAAVDQILVEAGVNAKDLNKAGEVKKVFDKIDQRIIEAVSPAEQRFNIDLGNNDNPAGKAENIIKALLGA